MLFSTSKLAEIYTVAADVLLLNRCFWANLFGNKNIGAFEREAGRTVGQDSS